MKLTLEVWRQAGPTQEGSFETVQVDDAVEQMSILELLDHVNTGRIEDNKEPFAFASDCREGICGTCIVEVLDGVPEHRDNCLSNKEKASNKQICACVSRALSARLVLDI